jgi:hypothetical protein
MKRLLVVALIVLCGACEHDNAPVAGMLNVTLTTPNSGGDRAILLKISGPEALTSAAASGTLRLFAQPPFGTPGTTGYQTSQFVLTGTLSAGRILTIGVADVGKAGSYVATVQQVSTPAYQLRGLTGYSLSVAP